MKERDDAPVSNPTPNRSFQEVLAQRLSRRDVLAGGLATAAMTLMSGGAPPRPARAATPLFGFEGVPVSRQDRVVVPSGYTAEALYAWGDPISDGPAFKPDASNTAEEQAQQAGAVHGQERPAFAAGTRRTRLRPASGPQGLASPPP
jgi:hypothetical protein